MRESDEDLQEITEAEVAAIERRMQQTSSEARGDTADLGALASETVVEVDKGPTEVLSVRLPSKLKQRLVAHSEVSGETMTDLVRNLLSEWIARQRR